MNFSIDYYLSFLYYGSYAYVVKHLVRKLVDIDSIRRNHTALPSSYLPNHSQTRQQRIEPLPNNLNLQTSVNNTSVTNTINSTQYQFSEDYNLSISRTPPAYKDVIQQNSIRITVEK
ncbi:unnamed protein product [Adineta ricciae]|uniref:Uncharacterized protein n=1 Tax=Adineta ricciae TaxID=249248 RepID=A0A815U743_ADIRI|nr:unnamed protein product [Adineta ricciae]